MLFCVECSWVIFKRVVPSGSAWQWKIHHSVRWFSDKNHLKNSADEGFSSQPCLTMSHLHSHREAGSLERWTMLKVTDSHDLWSQRGRQSLQVPRKKLVSLHRRARCVVPNRRNRWEHKVRGHLQDKHRHSKEVRDDSSQSLLKHESISKHQCGTDGRVCIRGLEVLQTRNLVVAAPMFGQTIWQENGHPDNGNCQEVFVGKTETRQSACIAKCKIKQCMEFIYIYIYNLCIYIYTHIPSYTGNVLSLSCRCLAAVSVCIWVRITSCNSNKNSILHENRRITSWWF